MRNRESTGVAMIFERYEKQGGGEVVVCVPDQMHKIKIELNFADVERLHKIKFQLKAQHPDRKWVSYSDAVSYLLWLATEAQDVSETPDTGVPTSSENSAGTTTSS